MQNGSYKWLLAAQVQMKACQPLTERVFYYPDGKPLGKKYVDLKQQIKKKIRLKSIKIVHPLFSFII